MSDIIVILVILAIVSASITKIVIEKKKGTKCIGCPAGGTSKNTCGCNTHK
ncbi:FeoB-associated Cys-rich membrane protein [Alkaliphilus serpentinus]|uniref:FeoB-associated Cys-rich membrane protein n=3 Tax=Alkaliphilus TaxID=114627 RepID=A0A833M8Z4_9FIRM|nr:FeoB-associated Cys-rich membrane protein [Alkaliphilus serpentinus]KAB3526248.1 FeoB-associated Cys-rich membrane protein [Alkaliphilus serpentinus]KAB3534075.1 FeoB-associated Cys-rich membrane protein [Alkaliphilus pronyensis]